jgi:FtsP/CotA-like multicopper oxidase with cupredoxin domain
VKPVSELVMLVFRFWPVVLFVTCLSGVSLGATEDGCPRPVPGAVVPEPFDIRSQHGFLRVELEYRSALDAQGQPRFCFVTKDGNQAPNLRVRRGDEVILSLKNTLPKASAPMMQMAGHAMSATCTTGTVTASSTNLHFHGLVIPPTCHQDDTLNTAIEPSDPEFEYRFRVPQDQPPGVYWYHPHIHGITRAHILGGASGVLIVEGIEAASKAVRGLPERVFVIRDQELQNPNADPVWTGPGPAPKVIRDIDGDVMNTGTGTGTPAKDLSINYVPVPFPHYPPAVIAVRPGQKQLWRVLNASGLTYLDLRLFFNDVPQSLGLVSLDGAPLNHEDPRTQIIRWKNHFLVPPAGRVEFIVTGPAAGVHGTLVTRSVDTGPVGDNDPVRTLAVIKASADAPNPNSTIPVEYSLPMRPRFGPLRAAKPVRQRLLYFSEEPADPKNPAGRTIFYFTVEGQPRKAFDPQSPLPNIIVHAGDVEDWTIENRSKELHAFHIHQTHFQLLESNGMAVDEPFLRDTVNVDFWREKMTEFPSVKLRMDFRDPAMIGTFPYHCHLLEHQDNGMMGVIRVEPRQVRGASTP